MTTDERFNRVKLLNLKDRGLAERVLSLQYESYLVEAELMGLQDLPPMRETPELLRSSGETFWGSFDGPELVGVLSTTEQGAVTEICRLAVAPSHFRRGIASRLLAHALGMAGPDATCLVSTGLANGPAIALYMKYGFLESARREVEPGVWLISLTRPPGA
ncbi:MAG: GNAT family N-acetyltransferase [Candidatus Sericytochromatia bacterium]